MNLNTRKEIHEINALGTMDGCPDDLDAMRLVGNVLRADNYALHRFHGR